MTDKLWIGQENSERAGEEMSRYQVDYTFGCQTSETGLFRTQLENGIMGMSMGSDSFPSQLYKTGITSSTVFGLCYSVNGGILTLGGIVPSIHQPSAPLNYAKLYKRGEWYGVKVLDMKLRESGGGEVKFEESSTISDSFTGSSMSTIVDSGTTDTYLPSSLSSKFAAKFKSISGLSFKSGVAMTISDSQLEQLPDILFFLEGSSGKSITVVMPWYSYVAAVGSSNSFEFTIFFQENHGAILGANFMDGCVVFFIICNLSDIKLIFYLLLFSATMLYLMKTRSALVSQPLTVIMMLNLKMPRSRLPCLPYPRAPCRPHLH